MTKSYDVLLDGEPYYFGRGGGMAPGSAALEPGPPRQVGTLIVPSPHHGYGQRVARDDQQMEVNDGFEAIPGTIIPRGKESAVTIRSTAFSVTSAVYPTRAVASFFENDKVFLIFPREIISVTSAGAIAQVAVAPIDFPAGGNQTAYTSVARWRGTYIIGIEAIPSSPSFSDSSQRYGYKYCEYDIGGDTFTNKVAGGDVAVSHVAAGPNVVFRIVNFGLRRPPELYLGDDPTVDFDSVSWVGPIEVHQGGYCTGVYTYGPHILMAKREGVLIGMDVGQVFSPIVTSPQGFDDDTFGFGIKQYLNWLVIPNKRSLMRLDPNTLQQTDISPSAVQNYVGTEFTNTVMGRVHAVAVRHTNELYAMGQPAVVVGGVDTALVTKGVTFKDGFHYTYCTAESSTGQHPRGGLIAEYANGTIRLVMGLRGEESAVGGVQSHDLYGPPLAPRPVAYGLGKLRTARISAGGAAAGLSVLPSQLRFWRGFPDAVATSAWDIALSVDDGAFTNIFSGTINGDGNTVIEIPSTLSPRIGRSFRIELESTALANDKDYRIDFPLALDYEFVPDTVDAITLIVSASSEQPYNIVGERTRDAGRVVLDRLIALEGTVVTMEFQDATQWTVLIRQVTSEMVKVAEPRTNSPTWLVTLDCRRL